MTELEQKFQEWLKENNAAFVVAARAPLGDVVKLENFIPQGWSVVVSVQERKEVKNDSSLGSS